MEQSNQSKKVLLSVIGVAILVVAVVGVSFAFFNYTRTGNTNTVRTGHIYFTTSQSEMNVTDLFPVAAATGQAVENNSTQNGGYATVTITGKTTYAGGLDYRVTAQDVNLTVANRELPVSVYVTEGTAPSAISSHAVYSYNVGNSSQVIANDKILAEGHIDAVAEDAANISHTITIRTYLDRARISISDTYDNGPEGSETTTTWQAGRTNFTTTEWNAFHEAGSATPVSWKIRVEASEASDGVNNPSNFAYTGANNTGAMTSMS